MISPRLETDPIRIRPLTLSDVPFADSLRAVVGWNQTVADWERFITHAPDGCFCAEIGGTPAGTATTTLYGADVAWIGMVLVSPALRRRGVGRALLLHCLEELRKRRIAHIQLDATPDGLRVYEPLGFVAEGTLTRWQRDADCPRRPATGAPSPVRELDDRRFEAFVDLDAQGFGVRRPRLLDALRSRSLRALALDAAPGRIAAGGLIRRGARALQLGPVAAESGAAGLVILDALLAGTEGEWVFCDVPDANTVAIDWLRSRGFTPQRSLTRMGLGSARGPGHLRRQLAIAGPDIG